MNLEIKIKEYVHKKILLIEDEKDFCDLLVPDLRKQEYIVACAFNLRQAAAQLNKASSAHIQQNAFEAGVNQFMEKPFSLASIQEIIKEPASEVRYSHLSIKV